MIPIILIVGVLIVIFIILFLAIFSNQREKDYNKEELTKYDHCTYNGTLTKDMLDRHLKDLYILGSENNYKNRTLEDDEIDYPVVITSSDRI